MVNPDRTVLVLYGSETGNAQDMAEDLGRLCQRLHFTVIVKELNDVELVSPPQLSREIYLHLPDVL